jgi:hypothetical protein
MASLKAIAAAAESYTFLKTGDDEGVVLAGRLGSAAVWKSGRVEAVDQAAASLGGTPYWATHTDPHQMMRAQGEFSSLAGW